MDSKRKANGVATPDTDDRVAKRRKLAESYDLSKGETRESTTAYGLSLVDQIRRTADKSGRLVAGYFETLPPREENAEYYKRTRMPISLESIEKKLKNSEFKNLSELESYFKRMISNAKEWFPRTSSTFDDAERVRKAVSNYMTKTNPAYQNRNYQAVPTPLPPEGAESAEDAEDEEAGDDAEAEDAGDDEEEEEDGDGDEEADDEDVGAGSRKRSIILKRRGPGRSARNSLAASQSTPRKTASTRPDHQYEDVPYKGLTFQQAQEKIVEEMIRHKEPDYESAYFEPFVNLPPRALKDYYKMIQEPLSLKKLQKCVKGIQGRNDPTGVSEFKSWSQFDEKTKLLWENAYYYNEEGSDIYTLAQELEKFFYNHLKQAQAVVSEPTQPKIKLKIGQQQNEQPSSAKKITIHVGSGRGGSADSPAPQTSQSVESPAPTQDANGMATHTQMTLAPVDKARSVSATAPSPSPSVQPAFKGEEARMSPAVRPPSATSGQMTPGIARPPLPTAHSQPQFQPVPSTPMEPKNLRAPGKGLKDALISRMQLQMYQNIPSEPSVMTVLPDPKDMQQSATINLPSNYNRVTMITSLPEFLQDRQYSLWAMVDKQPLKASSQPMSNQGSQECVFDVMLHPGVNVLEAHLIAALPRSERVVGGPEVELEIFTVFVNVMRN